MHEPNEIVVIEMHTDVRLKLYGQIISRMEKLGLNSMDYDELNLGFELPAGWPVDKDAQPTLAQLAVVARKLKLRIVISDLNLEPLPVSNETEESQNKSELATAD